MVKITNIKILFLLYFLASSIALVNSVKDNLIKIMSRVII